jgi:tetratricopeptide (TPR) repeat protein
VPVRYGIWIGHYLRAEHRQALPMVKKLVDETNKLGKRIPRLLAHRMCAATQVNLGMHLEARKNLEAALQLYEDGPRPEFSGHFAQEPGIQILAQLIVNLWLLGYTDQAAAMDAKSQALAKEIGHVNTTCYGSVHRVVYALLSGQDDLLRRSNEMVIRLAELHELVTWQAYSMFGDLLIRSRTGDVEALGELSIAIDKNTALGDWLFVPFYKTIQVSELLRHSRIEQALSEARITEGFIEQTGEEWVLPEVLRLKGEAKRAMQNDESAQDHFTRAMKLAAEQSAKSWELRTASSLASLLAERGQTRQAREVLRPVYDWFTQGRDTADLKTAKALLDALA